MPEHPWHQNWPTTTGIWCIIWTVWPGSPSFAIMAVFMIVLLISHLVLSALQSFSGMCLALIHAYKQALNTIKRVHQSPGTPGTAQPTSTRLHSFETRVIYHAVTQTAPHPLTASPTSSTNSSSSVPALCRQHLQVPLFPHYFFWTVTATTCRQRQLRSSTPGDDRWDSLFARSFLIYYSMIAACMAPDPFSTNSCLSCCQNSSLQLSFSLLPRQPSPPSSQNPKWPTTGRPEEHWQPIGGAEI